MSGLKKAGTFTKETGTKVKEKLDDIGVTDAAVTAAQKVKMGGLVVGGFIASTAKTAGSKINEKIDQNDKLAHARDVTKEKVG